MNYVPHGHRILREHCQLLRYKLQDYDGLIHHHIRVLLTECQGANDNSS